MIIKGLLTLLVLFNKKPLGEIKKPPLFKIRAEPHMPEIIYFPPETEIQKVLQKMIDNVKESGKHFPRWYKYHCKPVEVDSKYANTEDWVNPFTFDRDIGNHQIINGL